MDGSAFATRGRRFAGLGFATIFLTQLMLVVDASIVNVALPQIQVQLRFSVSGLSWVVTAYAVAFGGLVLVSGSVGSLVGARRALVIGTGLFVVASAVGGLSVTAEMLVVARVVQGIGAAIAAPSPLVLLIASTTPGPQRSRALAALTLASSSGGALGLILGGVLTTGLGWRWVMFVNVPIGLIVILGAVLFVTETPRRQARIDVAGGAASTVTMIALVFVFATASDAGWGNPVVVLAFAAAVLAFTVLLRFERRSDHPVVPLALFATGRRAVPYAMMLLVAGGMFAFFYFVALVAQNVLGFGPLGTGIALLPFVLTQVVASQLMTRVLPRFGEKLVGIVGLILMAAGLVWLSRLSASSTFLDGMLGPLVVIGIGTGLAFSTITGVALHVAPAEYVNAVPAVLQAMLQLGGAIGIAALTAVRTSVAAVAGATSGIPAAILGGAGFICVAVGLYSIWGARTPLDETPQTTPRSCLGPVRSSGAAPQSHQHVHDPRHGAQDRTICARGAECSMSAADDDH
jgi:EmrB/QacA subfamily drug resistance transporter